MSRALGVKDYMLFCLEFARIYESDDLRHGYRDCKCWFLCYQRLREYPADALNVERKGSKFQARETANTVNHNEEWEEKRNGEWKGKDVGPCSI